MCDLWGILQYGLQRLLLEGLPQLRKNEVGLLFDPIGISGHLSTSVFLHLI